MSDYPAEEGEWHLVSPSGRVYAGTSPIACIHIEQHARIPSGVALARIYEGIERDEAAEREALIPLLKRAWVSAQAAHIDPDGWAEALAHCIARGEHTQHGGDDE